MKSTYTIAMLGVSLSALAVPMHAAAQSTAPVADEADVSNDTIIVSARRRDESIQDVPAVINAVTADDIAALNLREFTEVQTLVPGLELSNNANGIGGNARLRGVNFDTNASGNNATVEFYLNDAPVSAGIVLQQMYDVGQIEVLRGPQGTLRGRASPSGSITITTRKPDLYEFGGYVEATANDLGTINTQGAVSIPLIEGVAAIRVAGLFDENELDRVRPATPISNSKDPFSRTKSGRITALIEPADWLKLEGTYQKIDRNFRSYLQVESFSQVNGTAPASPLLITAKDRLSIQEQPSEISQEFDIYNWRAQVALAGQLLIYQGSHTNQQLSTVENFDRGNLFVGRDVNQPTSTVAKGTTHELRLQNEERVAGMFDYSIGFFDSKLDSPTSLRSQTIVRLPVAFGGGIATIVETPVGRIASSHERSFFGHLTAHIGDSTEIAGGLRHINYKSAGQLLVNGNLIASDSQDVNKVIYTASINHKFSPDFMVYASTGSSFRPGISVVGNFNIARSALENNFLVLPPETSKSYEIGFKSNLMDDRVTLNVTAYQQKFQNFPYRIPGTGVYYVNTVAIRDGTGAVTGTAQQVANFNFVGAVPVKVRGVEAELAVKLNDSWDFSVVASYSDGKITNGTIPCTDLNGDGVPDVVTVAPTLAQLQAAVGANNISACTVSQRSAFLPPFSASIQSEYRVPVSDKVEGYLRGLLNLSGTSQGNPTNAFDDVGSYGLLNLFTGVRDPDGMWEATLFAKNVLNTTKVLTRTDPLSTNFQQLGFAGQFANGRPVFTGPTAGSFTSTYTGITTTAPQEFGLNVKFRFGSR